MKENFKEDLSAPFTRFGYSFHYWNFCQSIRTSWSRLMFAIGYMVPYVLIVHIIRLVGTYMYGCALYRNLREQFTNYPFKFCPIYTYIYRI